MAGTIADFEQGADIAAIAADRNEKKVQKRISDINK